MPSEKLTDTTIRSKISDFEKETKKQRKLFDGNGLFLWLRRGRSPAWRYKYRIDHAEFQLNLGTYPEVTLSVARDKHKDARSQVRAGENPVEVRHEEKAKAARKRDDRRAAAEAKRLDKVHTFGRIAGEWLLTKRKWSAGNTKRVHRLITRDLKDLSAKSIKSITKSTIRQVIEKIERRPKYSGPKSDRDNPVKETARRALVAVKGIFEYAEYRELIEKNPTAGLRVDMSDAIKRPNPAPTHPTDIGQLMSAVDSYDGHPVVAIALQLLPRVFTRPGELRHCLWRDVYDLNGENPQIRIPAARMKIKNRTHDHVVPLSTQCVRLIKKLQGITGNEQLMFPGLLDPRRPISENSLNAALRRQGWGRDRIVSHGFRSMASTQLHEKGFNSHAIELQLAHETKGTRAYYDRSTMLDVRTEMMQRWSDLLDQWRTDVEKPPSGNVVPIRSRRPAPTKQRGAVSK